MRRQAGCSIHQLPTAALGLLFLPPSTANHCSSIHRSTTHRLLFIACLLARCSLRECCCSSAALHGLLARSMNDVLNRLLFISCSLLLNRVLSDLHLCSSASSATKSTLSLLYVLYVLPDCTALLLGVQICDCCSSQLVLLIAGNSLMEMWVHG
ncbi:hypothetical protein O6H91_Y250500 [Diphasiastrum complanatum]|nr:hypothetical protein O6H91_Y250500 [Diphasiastrum complanatum]